MAAMLLLGGLCPSQSTIDDRGKVEEHWGGLALVHPADANEAVSARRLCRVQAGKQK